MSNNKLYALVEPSGRVAQIEENTFPVHQDFKWVECPNSIHTEWFYLDGEFLSPEKVTKE